MNTKRRRVASLDLPEDVLALVLRWLSPSALATLSCTCVDVRAAALRSARVSLEELAAAATSWDAFLVGAAPMYELGRLLGHRPKVPYMFAYMIAQRLADFMLEIRIDAPALELAYVVLGATYDAAPTERVTGIVRDVTLTPSRFHKLAKTLMEKAILHAEHADDDEVRLQDVARSLPFLAQRALRSTSSLPKNVIDVEDDDESHLTLHEYAEGELYQGCDTCGRCRGLHVLLHELQSEVTSATLTRRTDRPPVAEVHHEALTARLNDALRTWCTCDVRRAHRKKAKDEYEAWKQTIGRA